MRWLVAAALVACACPSKQPTTTNTRNGGGIAGGGSAVLTGCDGAAATVSGLYRADGHTDEAIGDNTAMVLAHCAKDPAAVTACIAGVSSVKDLEATCLPALDEEGSEADVLAP